MNYFEYSDPEIRKGRFASIDKMKIYAQSQNEDIFDTIDFDNDEAFSEPLLVAHFFAFKNKRAVPQLSDLMYGYHTNRIPQVQLGFNEHGTGYLPNVGYFEGGASLANTSGLVTIPVESNGLAFNPVIQLGSSRIELYRSIPELLRYQFKDMEQDEAYCLSPEFTAGLVAEKQPYIEEALQVLQQLLPDYHRQMLDVARGIFLFRSAKLVSFASRVSPGIIYLNVQPQDALIFFIVELIHQYGHNLFYNILHAPMRFFRISPDTPLQELNGNEKEHRSLYSAFHGLFTTTKVAYGLEQLIQHITSFTEEQGYEIIGRFVDNRRRFRTGLERMNLDKVFTEEGKKLYHLLDNECEEIYNRNDQYIKDLTAANQQFVYSHEIFMRENLQYIKTTLDSLIISH